MKHLFSVVALLGLSLCPAFGADTVWPVATVASTASLSGAMKFDNCTPIRMTVVSASTVANITFQLSTDGVTYGNFRDMYSEVTATVGAVGDVIQLDAALFYNARYVKLRFGTAATPVAQSAGATVKVECALFK